MRAIRCLTLLLALFTPVAFAEGLYQVEMILLQQNDVTPATSPRAPEDWRGAVPMLSEDALRPTRLEEVVTRLRATPSYTVLMHKAWEQQVGNEPARVALTEGDEQFGHFPIEGSIGLMQDRFVAVEANFWINRLDANGSLLQSEQFKQENRTVKHGQLTFLDGGHLALLLKVAPVGARKMPTLDPEMMGQ
ncbi:hypothetical protein G7009_09915 [Pseudomonas capeferrum]|uniref:CsiV family protein n=1 Tax=Pseudomonas capeferrum TaxID=1495066 RepID=UPI0015E39253|nr:CsiV family protein [Pseudomonas capeferrum]MBA1202069.1 hypothetical protein [Pseudomonas capeferrum]